MSDRLGDPSVNSDSNYFIAPLFITKSLSTSHNKLGQGQVCVSLNERTFNEWHCEIQTDFLIHFTISCYLFNIEHFGSQY